MTPRLTLAVLALAALAAAQGPENVLLIQNTNSSDSRQIAAYYTQRRAIPKANLCSLKTRTDETVDRGVYDREIEKPIAACLARPHAAPILYLVTTKGVPLRIDGSQGPKGNAASVDSELVLLYARSHGKNITIEGPISNPYFRQRDAPFKQPQFPLYLVARLTAFDVPTVKRMIDDGLRASNRGVFALDLRAYADPKGDNWMWTAEAQLPRDRVLVESTEKVLTNQRNVIGYCSWGSNDRARPRNMRKLGFSWLAGSVAIEYVSTNGRTFHRPDDKFDFNHGQSLTGDYLDEGASAALGSVYEPYLDSIARPDYLFPAYYSGRNLIESFYIALPAVSWMQVVVGDPLMKLGPPPQSSN